LLCKDFLKEISEYLDETACPTLREELHKHMNECPNCWVVLDTTKKTVNVFKGMEPQAIPPRLHSKLMAAVERKAALRRGASGT
jgi:hypothetical protein